MAWNHANRTVYVPSRVRLDHVQPTGKYDDIPTGFVAPKGNVWGRASGVIVAADGTLLI